MKHKIRSISFLVMGFLALAAVAGQGQDIILDPIETTPQSPSARSLAVGNWGYAALIGSNGPEIQRRATRPVVVYIFDTGGKYTHPGLLNAAWNERGRTFTGEPTPDDGNGHSTHVASSYAGKGQSGEAVGICDGLLAKSLIRLVPIKVLSNGGSGSFANTNAALDAVLPEVRDLIRTGNFVIYNFSLGGGTAVLPDTESRLKAARDAGVFIVAAAGNSGAPGVIFPASGPAADAIASLNSDLTKSYYSTTGAEVWGADPGAAIYGCWPPNVYRELSGTSMATPHAGAVAAIVASVYPSASADQVRAHIEKYARDLGPSGRDTLFGYGFPNITAMLANAPGDAPPNPDPDPEPPKPEPGPERDITAQITKTYSVPWFISGEAGRYNLTFRLTVKYTNRDESTKAVSDLVARTDQHFKSRGYILLPGSDEYTAAFWVGYFYRMLMKNDYGMKVEPVRMTIDKGHAVMERTDFATRPEAWRAKKRGIQSFILKH